MDEPRGVLDDARREVERLSELVEARTQRLCDLEELLALVLDQVDDVVVALDGDLVVEAVSRAAEVALGVGAERLVGRRLPDVRHSAGGGLVDAICAAATAVRRADGPCVAPGDEHWSVRSARCSPPANGWVLVTACPR